MTIETYCRRCKRTISTLLILGGILHPDNILELDIEDTDLTCTTCYETDASILRIVGGTTTLESAAEVRQA